MGDIDVDITIVTNYMKSKMNSFVKYLKNFKIRTLSKFKNSENQILKKCIIEGKKGECTR